MRIRQVKPAFWSDAKLAALSHDARLFYIGLWMMADDDGWLRWDVAQMGAELYGFEGRGPREKRIERMAGAIQSMPGSEKLIVLECGHAELPKLAVHQHLAGTTRRVTTVHDEHERCPSREAPQIPATNRDSPPRIGKVKVGEGVVKGLVGLPAGEMTVSMKPPEDEELISRDLAILEDPDSPEWKRDAAKAHLELLGVSDAA